MDAIPISKFKATCLSLLEEVRRTRRPLLVTRFGKPVAQIVPPDPPKAAKRKLGGMAKTVELAGDIVTPSAEALNAPEVRR
ncbi:MAG: type II toxin-antitoxin system Phd/YefM family antitoxin [Bryobacterales bacterium]